MTDTFATLRAEAETPDGKAFASIVGRDQVRFGFAPGVYAGTSRAQLEAMLGRLALRVWTERVRATRAFLEGDLPLSQYERPRDAQQQEYYERLATVSAEGTSPDGAVTVAVVGLTHFTVRIADGALDRLTEQQFCDAGSEACRRMIEDLTGQVIDLKRAVFR